MVLYLTIILVAVAVATLVNSLVNFSFFNCSPFLILVIMLVGVIIEIAIDGLFAFIIHSLPNKMFYETKSVFKVGRRERKLYEKLHIKSWKDKVVELGGLGGFRKNKIYNPNSSEYLRQFIIESNKGLVGHIFGIVFGFLILLYPLPKYWLCVGLPIALVNTFLNILPCMILRYNIPKLTVAYERARRTEEFNKKEQENEDK